MAPSLSPQVPAGEPGQVSALCPLPVLTDKLTRPLLTRCHGPSEPSVCCPEHWGWSLGASRQPPSLRHLPGTSTLFLAPAGGKELCCSWLAQPLLQPGTVMDRLATCGWRGQACAHAYTVWQPTRQRNKYICFGNAAGVSMQPTLGLQHPSIRSVGKGAAGYRPLLLFPHWGITGLPLLPCPQKSAPPIRENSQASLKKKIFIGWS